MYSILLKFVTGQKLSYIFADFPINYCSVIIGINKIYRGLQSKYTKKINTIVRTIMLYFHSHPSSIFEHFSFCIILVIHDTFLGNTLQHNYNIRIPVLFYCNPFCFMTCLVTFKSYIMLLTHVQEIIPTIVKCVIDCVIRTRMYYIVIK